MGAASAALRLPPPTFQLLGAELIEAFEGRAKVRFVPGQETANLAGLFHGGMLAAADFFACSPLVEHHFDCAPSVLFNEHADAVVALFLSGLCAKAKPAKGRARRRR